MKKLVMLSALGWLAATSGVASAQQEVGRVISATPVVQQVPVPRQVCSVQPVASQNPGAGAVIGAIAGGLLGNTIGHGTGRAAATGLGIVAGAAIGNNVENNNGYARNGQYCTTESTYENRTVAYNVTYEYQGRQYSTQMAHDPGPTIQLQVTPVGANPPPFGTFHGDANTHWTPRAQIISSQVIASPMVEYPVYSPGYAPGYSSGYYPRQYYSPVVPLAITLGLGYYAGQHHHHHRHRHWR